MVLKRKSNPVKTQSVGLIKTSLVQADSGYEPFLLDGFVSFSGQLEDRVAVRVLRDTGAARSLMRGDVLPFSKESGLDSSILVQGISMEVIKVPLHRVHLQSELVTGFVDVGVRPTLPVPGIEFILGNDLAGGRVLPVLEVLDNPVITPTSAELTQRFPEVFPACVLTRSQTKRMGTEFTLDDTFMCTDHPVQVDVESVSVKEHPCQESESEQRWMLVPLELVLCSYRKIKKVSLLVRLTIWEDLDVQSGDAMQNLNGIGVHVSGAVELWLASPHLICAVVFF
ncbi:uncharacterized protein LOC122344704 [Puntigrus tetrazona]|uniref:uncharacterized protein LOC122344704 n=1 Tax=Puntigrus tetrazona TaxID=1606681 RepID=UPI001C894678|nr:uncharacterized protein LOC122344704 [Puntigrus tetrazona]